MVDWFIYSENEPLLFTQSFFWVLFGFVILFYQRLYKHINARNLFLCIFSLYFYYLSSGFYFLLLLFSTFVDYHIGNRVFESDNQKERKWLVALSVVINLGLLGYFKYAYFIVSAVNDFFGTSFEATNYVASFMHLFNADVEIGKIILPVGISFYTFQTISYTVDIYRRKLEPVKSIWDFAFFVSFFPQLVAGPIVRASDFVPQIYQKYRLTNDEFGKAIFMIMGGLVKKIFISDYISINFVDRVFTSPEAYTGFENLMATYGYGLQIYCDFSGYTDIAIGIALLLGFRLPLNFNSPYKSQNITDFWRRWHISLSSWLRDYLYISMGGNRKGRIRTYLHLAITMLLGGLWHGAHWRFIIWGALHGVALAIHKMWMEMFGKSSQRQNGVYRFFAWLFTFHFVMFCWIFFRADNLEVVWTMLDQIVFAFDFASITDVIVGYHKVFLVILIGYILHFRPTSWKEKLEKNFIYLPDISKAFIILLLIIFLFQSKSSEIQPFIYFQF
ncbi:MBOAT family O-acyltransferase [Sediminitomix flava]|uniref:D-alanyl-lipoteichoic acid acyltransferase DltB (MBOAT superfamily) n=1 Tax=Sediminitomix flava TaxID=379075 RepID=A0A315ZCG8_SEDFL|nr:MBOAT family protein [Sediminitomix flava]PWJ42518.1 D-alanyl-lipoteichoic acid acyltransferase DltB (MBOAT superfamily) [Sediminitomix flava]